VPRLAVRTLTLKKRKQNAWRTAITTPNVISQRQKSADSGLGKFADTLISEYHCLGTICPGKASRTLLFTGIEHFNTFTLTAEGPHSRLGTKAVILEGLTVTRLPRFHWRS